MCVCVCVFGYDRLRQHEYFIIGSIPELQPQLYACSKPVECAHSNNGQETNDVEHRVKQLIIERCAREAANAWRDM